MTSDEIVVFWRPGCIFCASLLSQLDARAVPHRRVNIWEDPSAAAQVRAAAGGNETVPTVAVGSVMLVNPDVHTLLSVAAQHVPSAVPAGYEPPQSDPLSRWTSDRLGGTTTE
ncbi:glutaredoxin domain-containing protein [Desertimonas flava]|uniref:glutaredoxin domain-containing protein n=1 Tax=Desertimonas flava TaxID=2064846 RepID=UPI000E34352D|nr:glutaredoxin domain-containing protein [Desertimonas flava]